MIYTTFFLLFEVRFTPKIPPTIDVNKYTPYLIRLVGWNDCFDNNLTIIMIAIMMKVEIKLERKPFFFSVIPVSRP